MKIAAVLGSPRLGNTEALFNAFAEGAKEGGAQVGSALLRSKTINTCRGCEACFQTGECVVQDDFQEVARMVDDCHTFVIVTPVQFGGPSSNMSAFFSRCQQFWGRKYVLKKADRPRAKEKGAGVLISACGGKGMEYFHCVKRISQYVLNSLDFTPLASLCIPGMEGFADAKSRPGMLKEAHDLGVRISRKRWDGLEW